MGSWASLVAQLVKIRMQVRRPGFNFWVGQISWRRERLPTPVFWPRESQGLYSPRRCKELDTTEQLSLSLYGFLDMKSFRHIIDHIPRTTDTFLKNL